MTVYEAANEEDELSFVASMIKKEVYGRSLRYRDISLLLPDVAAYAVKLKRRFPSTRPRTLPT